MERARHRGYPARFGASAAGLFASAVISASLIGYFVSPYELPALLRAGGAPAAVVTWSLIVLTAVLFLDLIALRRGFCATACPYAKMQGVLFDDRTLVVAFDGRRSEECMRCNACVTSCPVGIDIRKGTQIACIHCAECVDACTQKMSGKNKASLVRYMFGLPGKRGSGMRVNPLITGIISVIALVFLMYLALTRMPFDMNVRLNYTGIPQVLTYGSVTNSYILSLRNMGAIDLDLDLQAAAPTGIVTISPETVVLKHGMEITTVPVSVTSQKRSGETHYPRMVTLTLSSKKLNKSIAKTVYFVLPKE